MAQRFWRAVFVLAALTAIPGGLLAYVALKHLLPSERVPFVPTKEHFRPQAWARMH